MQTKRLRLELIDVRHARELLAYYARNREHLLAWEPERPDSFYTLEAQEAAARQCMEGAKNGSDFRFVAFEEGAGRVVACVSLHEFRRGIAQDAIVGYSVDSDRQGRGYATESVAAVIAYGFDVLNLHRIHTSYQPLNVRSGRVLRKLGFVVEGYRRDQLWFNGAWQDGILVGILNPGWKNQLS